MTYLTLSSLRKYYRSAPALSGIDLAVKRGSRTTILGPSGSGKTTLLKLIAGFDAPDTGTVVLDGQILADAQTFVPAHRRGIGVVMQDGALFPHLTVSENIGFGLAKGPDRRRRVKEMLDLVDLDKAMLDRRPDQLSGGQQQRVALARALAMRPRLLLMDEPFSALDTGLRTATRKAVVRVLDSAGVTAILVTHDQAEALSFSDQVVLLREGRVVQSGSPTDLYFRPKDSDTATFIGEAVILQATISAGRAICSLGQVPVDTEGFEGKANILLRPEQISLEVLDGNLAERTIRGALAVVETIEFAGSVSTVSVRLIGANSTIEVLHLRNSAVGLLVGSVVQVIPSGIAFKLQDSLS